MKWFTELRNENFQDKPWLVLGKGPSFDRFYHFTPGSFNILALNHVGLVVCSEITVFIDLDVFSERLLTNSRFVVAAQHPHVNFKVSTRTLQELLPQNNHKRLFQFRCSTWKKTTEFNSDNQPTLQVKFNVAEAAFGILGYLGIKEVYSLGIDGGKDYAKKFKKYKPLSNGQPNFDKQLGNIKELCKKFNITWEKL